MHALIWCAFLTIPNLRPHLHAEALIWLGVYQIQEYTVESKVLITFDWVAI